MIKSLYNYFFAKKWGLLEEIQRIYYKNYGYDSVLRLQSSSEYFHIRDHGFITGCVTHAVHIKVIKDAFNALSLFNLLKLYILKDFSDSDVEPCKEPFEQLEQLAEESQNEKVEGFKSKYFIDACIKQVYVCIGSFDLENKIGNNMCIWLWILMFIIVIYMIHS